MMKRILGVVLLTCMHVLSWAKDDGTTSEWRIALKKPGNKATTYVLHADATNQLQADKPLPVLITRTVEDAADVKRITVTLEAKERLYYNFEEVQQLAGFVHKDCQFLMPGFWYRKNLRSPKEAPSFATSDSWQVREDRLSTPLTGIYNEQSQDYYTVLRVDKLDEEVLTTHSTGEVILSGRTSLGSTGFRNHNNTAALVFGFPYSEAPYTYLRKLTLAPSVQAFEKLEQGEKRTLTWEIRKGRAVDYSTFVADVWNYSFDVLKPAVYPDALSTAEAKKALSGFFTQSYVDRHELKYFSGIHMRVDDCASNDLTEVGFIGRVLLNAFNALEYAEANGDAELARKANSIFDSYLQFGFTANGFFREFVDFKNKSETQELSIRRQSEGLFAVLNYLAYEKGQKRMHPEWEERVKKLFINFDRLQQPDGKYPRKFDDAFNVVDPSGGSTPSAVLPLTMAYSYFKQEAYLKSAKRSAGYLERELIDKADYFSSTLDANCEDKEASLYASTAMHYLAQVTKGKERSKYVDLCQKAAYFCLSWYYLWDVPFAQGQMLGDVDFKTRGWGNVSVENNHVDVFIFEFAAILDWLAVEKKESRFSAFSSVIKTSMLQLMPVEGAMFDVAKTGYYPEVVQHTNWDYGKNGKGFYNDIFAPGWTVASLWQLLSPDRVSTYFNKSGK